ncbi:ATP-dependent helicase [Candidatus Saccharibacteria bacterium]|nr:ATP-dependent helicase [Candidatus Saccharibacteria bacterium]
MYKFDEIYGILNDQQKLAVDTTDGPLLVLAGPGTGKTQLLSARVANILKKTDTLAQSILCLTFTEAASLNMRERLNSMIGELAYDVHINTYHGFASDIIKTYPEFFETIDLETGQDARLERPIDELRQLEVVKDIIEALPFTDPLRSARYYVKSVVGAIADFKQANLSADELREIAGENSNAVQELSPKINELMAVHGRIPGKTALALELFSSIANTLTENTSSLTLDASKTLQEALGRAEEENSTKPLTAWKNQWLVKDENDQWTFTNPESAGKLLSLANIYEQYQRVVGKAGQYDFNDMIISTIAALKRKPELKYNLQEKYQYILLDEFQDTNAAQFELVKLLADHPLQEGRPNIMAVGDDDQGIFAFQGADIGNMVAFTTSFKQVVVINLVKNYRSHHDILHVAHNIAQQIESRLHHNLENISKDIESAADNLPKNATIARHEFASQASEYGWIGEQIAELIKDGVPAEEIAVLAPKHVILEALVPFLNSHGVPVAYEKRENIFDTPVIQSVLLQTEFLRAAGSQKMTAMDAFLPKVLSLDFWGIPTSDIWDLNWDFYAKKFETYTPWAQLALKKPSTMQATEFLLRVGSLSDTTSLEIILDYITGAKSLQLDDGTTYTSPMKSYYFSEAAQNASPLQFYEAISHLSVIRSHLRDQQSQTDSQLTIDSLLGIYETYQEAEQPLLNTHPIAQSESAVQLQTVYKAKGLEYQYVFLPCMHDDVWGSTATFAGNKISLPANLKHIRHDASSEDTKRRLLFVAITRARYGLYTTSYAQKENGKKTLPAKYYLESEGGNGRISQILPENVNQVFMTTRAPEQARQDVDTLWHSRHLVMSPNLRSLLKDRLARYVMSPTHLNTFTNIEYAGPQAFLLNTLLRFPEAASADSIYGDALHKSLEWFQKQGTIGNYPSILATTEHFTNKIERSFLSRADKTSYSDRGSHALKCYLAANGERLKTNALAEVDFRKEGVTLDGAILTGKIDRLEIDKVNKTVRIIDFKSGSPSTKWSSQTKYLSYKQQLYFYILLIEKSHTYRNYKVESAALEFIEPLSNGKSAPPLVLKYDDQEYADFKRLIAAVWHKIQALALPDVSGYATTPVGMRAFISDLIKS